YLPTWSSITPKSTLSPYTTLFRSDLDADLRGRDRLREEFDARVEDAECHHDHHECGGHATDDREAVVERPAQLPRVPLDHPRNRSEEHTSELQSRENLVCRLLLEK